MRITRTEIHQVHVARQHRTVVGTGRGTVVAGAADAPTRSRFALLLLHTDTGHTGLGEWSDLEAGLEPQALQGQLEHLLVGHNPCDLERILAAFPLDRSTRCAVDCALHDLMGKALGVPLYELLGGCYRPQVPVSWVVYIREPDLIGEEIAAMCARGFTAFKLKVGSRIDHDEACVRIIRETAGSAAEIKLDASGAWTLAEAIEYIPRLARYRLQAVESPVQGRGAADLARVRRAVGVPIIEHVWDRWDYVLDLVRHEAVDLINLFPEGCGGLLRCKKVLALAEAAGIGALLGSTVELGVGTAAQIHLGVSSPGITYPSDLIGPAMYREDVIRRPFSYQGGALLPPPGPGLGVELDLDQLARLGN